MSRSEGLSRLSKAITWIGIGLTVLVAAVGIWGASTNGSTGDSVIFVLVLGWPGPLLVLVGWIVGGFARSREDSK